MHKHKVSDEIFDKYFYYGIDNKSELEDGLIYYANESLNLKNIYPNRINKDGENAKFFDDSLAFSRQEIEQHNEELKNQHINELADEAFNVFKQYYRFILLPEDKKIFNNDINENKETYIRQSIIEKIRSLEERNFLKVYPMGIFFGNDKRNIYKERDIIENNDEKSRIHYKNWTKDLYETFLYLSEIEHTEPIKYEELWINTKYHRALSRSDETEMSTIGTIKRIFDERKKIYLSRYKNAIEDKSLDKEI